MTPVARGLNVVYSHLVRWADEDARAEIDWWLNASAEEIRTEDAAKRRAQFDQLALVGEVVR